MQFLRLHVSLYYCTQKFCCHIERIPGSHWGLVRFGPMRAWFGDPCTAPTANTAESATQSFVANRCIKLWPIQESKCIICNELHKAFRALQAVADSQESTVFFLGSVVRAVIFGMYPMAPAYYRSSEPTLMSAVLTFSHLKTPVQVQGI